MASNNLLTPEIPIFKPRPSGSSSPYGWSRKFDLYIGYLFIVMH